MSRIPGVKDPIVWTDKLLVGGSDPLQSSTVTTIEGNTTADGVKGSQANGGEVCIKVRAYRPGNKRRLPVTIMGFGIPKFKD